MFAFEPATDEQEEEAPRTEARLQLQPQSRQEARPEVASIDPVDVAEDMMVAMNRLSDLLEVENEALTRHRHDVTVAIQDEKTALTRLYVLRLKALAENAGRLEQARAERGEELRETAERLKRLSEMNAILLRSAMAATQRYLDAVVSSVRELGNKPRYQRNGSVLPIREAASLSFNQTL